jgi:hypothetical protein
MHIVERVPLSHLDSVWPHVVDFANEALEYSFGQYDLEDIYEEIRSRSSVLWVVMDGTSENLEVIAVCTTKRVEYPRTTSLLIHMLSGEGLAQYGKTLLHELTEYGRATKCTHLEMYGRPGWSKLLRKEAGFDYQYVVLTKELSL